MAKALLILLVVFVLILLVGGVILRLQPFLRQLHQINMELERCEVYKRARWRRRRRRLWLWLFFPFLG